MTPGAVAARFALLGAAWSATTLARRLPTHRPIAAALWLSLAADLLRFALRELGAPVEALRSLYVAHPAISVWLAAIILWRPAEGSGEAVLLPPPASGTILLYVASVWIGVAGGLWIEPQTREEFARVAATWCGLALAAELALVVYRFRRLRAPTFTEFAVLMLIAGDLANVLGAWLYEDVWRAWELNRWQLAVVFMVVWYGQARRRAWVMTFAPGSARGSSRLARSSRFWRSW